MFEREYRELAYVPRWGIARMLRPQSVAEHSYYVVLYAIQAAQIMERPDLIAQAAELAAYHDVPEAFSTDIAAPAKSFLVDKAKETRFDRHIFKTRFGLTNPGDRTWDEGVKEIVKFADILDVVMKLCEEVQLGNKTLGDPSVVLYPSMGKNRCNHHTVCDRNCPLLFETWVRMFVACKPYLKVEGEKTKRQYAEEEWKKHVAPALVGAIHGVSHIFMPDEEVE